MLLPSPDGNRENPMQVSGYDMLNLDSTLEFPEGRPAQLSHKAQGRVRVTATSTSARLHTAQ